MTPCLSTQSAINSQIEIEILPLSLLAYYVSLFLFFTFICVIYLLTQVIHLAFITSLNELMTKIIFFNTFLLKIRLIFREINITLLLLIRILLNHSNLCVRIKTYYKILMFSLKAWIYTVIKLFYFANKKDEIEMIKYTYLLI